MPALAGAGDGTRHRRVAEDPFEKELRPGATTELRRPAREFLPRRPTQRLAPSERAVCEDRDAALRRERQQAPFGLRLGERVVDLEKVELLRAEQPLDVGVRPFR